jgi:hypothetical protein
MTSICPHCGHDLATDAAFVTTDGKHQLGETGNPAARAMLEAMSQGTNWSTTCTRCGGKVQGGRAAPPALM